MKILRLLRTSETVEIDGKIYDEDLNEVIPSKVQQQPQQPSSITVKVRGNNFTFDQGQTYKDAAGRYRVVSIENGKLKVVYLDGAFAGQQRIYDPKDRALIVHNEMMREQRLINPGFNIFDGGFLEDHQFFVMGLVAKYGQIAIQIPESDIPLFKKTFERLTGNPPSERDFLISKDETKWLPQYRIHIPLDESSENGQAMIGIFQKMELTPKTTAVGFDINHSGYVKQLLSLGFKPGKSADAYKTIARNIMVKYGRREAISFLKGFGIEHPEEEMAEIVG